MSVYSDWPAPTEEHFYVPEVFADEHQPFLKGSSTVVYLALCRLGWFHVEDPGHPPVSRLAEMCGLSAKTVRKALAELNTRGLLPEGTPQSGTSVSDALRWEIWERDDFTCQYCGTRRDLTIDHITPRAVGGSDAPENLQTLCRTCNGRKGARV